MCATRIRKSGRLFSIACLAFIWIFAFVLSSPLFLFNLQISVFDTVPPLTADFSQSSSDDAEPHSGSGLGAGASNSSAPRWPPPPLTKEIIILDEQVGTDTPIAADDIHIFYCIENSPFHQSRLVYSYVSLIIQYMLPILIVALAYSSIWWKLKTQRSKLKRHQSGLRASTRSHAPPPPPHGTGTVAGQKEATTLLNTGQYGQPPPHADRNTKMSAVETAASERERKSNAQRSRRLKMNVLLATIALIFAGSWLPLNIFNILSDSKVSNVKVDNSFYLINAICILFAMSSAVSNPFLYGFLNENFKKEYVTLFRDLIQKVCFTFYFLLTSKSNEMNEIF